MIVGCKAVGAHLVKEIENGDRSEHQQPCASRWGSARHAFPRHHLDKVRRVEDLDVVAVAENESQVAGLVNGNERSKGTVHGCVYVYAALLFSSAEVALHAPWIVCSPYECLRKLASD